MASALHPQTIPATRHAKGGLPEPFGRPLRPWTSTEFGFRNPEHITATEVTNSRPGGCRPDRGFTWFSGIRPGRCRGAA